MTDFTRDWIAKREQLEEAATEGPWDATGGEISQHWSRPEPWETIIGTDVACGSYCYGGSATGVECGEDAEFIADARTSLPAAVAALKAVLTFATAERDKIDHTYIAQPGTAYAGYANAMDDVICTIEDVLRGES